MFIVIPETYSAKYSYFT